MYKFKINIIFPFKEGPWGGGNQFLKALRKELEKENVYKNDWELADVILFNSSNSFENLKPCFEIKKKYPEKIIILRIDGPISFARGRDKELDEIIALFSNLFADGIIFQSNWSREKNKEIFNISSKYEIVIHNAADNEIFNKNNKKEFNPNDKIKLIATSWSSNWRKGFGVYRWLDENLDFSKYQMTFVGRSPIKFKNIKWIEPVFSEKLAEILKQHDIYITAAQKECCSNSLIEALSCGLPAVALNDGGNSELIKEGGELFNGKEDVIEKIKKVAQNYSFYQSRVPEFSIKEVTERYYDFAKKIYQDVQNHRYQPKRVNFFAKVNFYKTKSIILRWQALSKIRTAKEKIWRR